MFDIEKLYEAESLQHAALLLEENKGAKLIAGGSDVLIKCKEGKGYKELISIYKLDELRGAYLNDEEDLIILPLCSFAFIEENPIINNLVPTLSYAAGQVGGPQIRNIGTIGGNICNGVTSADTSSTLMAYDCLLEIFSSKGSRLMPISEFYLGVGKVALEQGEILAKLIIKKPSYENCFGHYIKYAMRDAMDIATLGVSANVVIEDGEFKRIRIGYSVCAPIPIRAIEAEKLALGKKVCMGSIEAIAKKAQEETKPRSSWRASREFRLHLVYELTKRALVQAVENAGGKLDGEID